MVLCINSYGLRIQAQSTIPVTGGNSTGTGGSVSYSVGQLTYQILTGTTGTLYQGIQQPYEISIVTEINYIKQPLYECTVYPNPTSGVIKLVVGTNDSDNIRYQLYNLNGVLFQNKKVESEETEVLMGNLMPSTYFLKVLIGNNEIRTFKIIKR